MFSHQIICQCGTYCITDTDLCCERCLITKPSPSLCCDICNPLLLDTRKTTELPPKPPRNPRQTRVLPSTNLKSKLAETRLRTELRSWREEAAMERWGEGFPFGGLGIISNPQIDRIVGLAWDGVLADSSALQRELKWAFHGDYDSKIIEIVHRVFPPAPVPVQKAASQLKKSLDTAQQDVASPAKRRAYKCRACGATGHNGKLDF